MKRLAFCCLLMLAPTLVRAQEPTVILDRDDPRTAADGDVRAVIVDRDEPRTVVDRDGTAVVVDRDRPTTVLDIDRPISISQLEPTPEMWFYEQNQRLYRDPRVAVRKKAEFRAAQRQRRLAAQAWYGFTPSRPTVSPTPYYGSYSPHWAGNSYDPFVWRGTVSPTVIVAPEYRTLP